MIIFSADFSTLLMLSIRIPDHHPLTIDSTLSIASLAVNYQSSSCDAVHPNNYALKTCMVLLMMMSVWNFRFSFSVFGHKCHVFFSFFHSLDLNCGVPIVAIKFCHFHDSVLYTSLNALKTNILIPTFKGI